MGRRHLWGDVIYDRLARMSAAKSGAAYQSGAFGDVIYDEKGHL
jgi:hypothetical protein